LRDYHWCSIGKKIVVDADGETYPCATLMEKQFRLGNSYSHSLAEIIDSKKMKSYSDLLLNRRDTITGCSHCHFRNLCQSSCMGQAFSHTGSILKKDYFCGFRKKEYETAFKKILSNFGC
jgi:radical SAM protein with 4Fe4S-binding SPASM domain